MNNKIFLNVCVCGVCVYVCVFEFSWLVTDDGIYSTIPSITI